MGFLGSHVGFAKAGLCAGLKGGLGVLLDVGDEDGRRGTVWKIGDKLDAGFGWEVAIEDSVDEVEVGWIGHLAVRVDAGDGGVGDEAFDGGGKSKDIRPAMAYEGDGGCHHVDPLV